MAIEDDIEQLRSIVERKEVIRHWGDEHTVTPRLVQRSFGDGKKLASLVPLGTRPNYYVVRVGSNWNNDDWLDSLDDIPDAINDQFGAVDFECEVCGGTDSNFDGCECQTERHFPRLDLSCGVCWGDYKAATATPEPDDA